jgi:hypothetical protein
LQLTLLSYANYQFHHVVNPPLHVKATKLIKQFQLYIYHWVRSISLLAHHPWHTSLELNCHFCCPDDVRGPFVTKSCFNILIFILNLWYHTSFRFSYIPYKLKTKDIIIYVHDDIKSVSFTCDSIIGPPCEAYKPSDFIMFTIFVVKFCM